ncbi:MAG: ATPase [Proteobacteria bacterium]|nr:ATPase [Pseudomonadota bacterium]
MAALGDGFIVTLDAMPLLSPAKAPMRVPTKALAEAIAEEWRRQGETVLPATMPLTTLIATALDRVLPESGPAVAEICSYAQSELLCYRADRPPELCRRQARDWQPWLDWASERYGARLEVTEGVAPVRQSETALAAIRKAVLQHQGLTLMALHALTQTLGSVVLALAVVEGRLDAAAAAELALLEETCQAEQWGEDDEAAERRAAIRADAAISARFLALIRVL